MKQIGVHYAQRYSLDSGHEKLLASVTQAYNKKTDKGRTIHDLGWGSGKSGKKRLNNWKENVTQLNNLEEKKTHHELQAGLRCPEHGHTCLLDINQVQIINYFEEAS